jgi:MarR family transcriptional regulator, 2-MHQ and catechol-resistance regulon repressor
MDMKKKENETEPIEIDDFRLWKLFDHARFMIARSREMELARYCLTPEQAHILDILTQRGGSTTINEIVELTMRQHHSISTLINRMTKQGLVNKIQTPNDKRAFNVVMTDKGRDLFKNLSTESIQMIFTCLSPEDKRELNVQLRKLVVRSYNLLGREYRSRLKKIKPDSASAAGAS